MWKEIFKQCEPDLLTRKQAVTQELDALGSRPCEELADTRAAVFKWDRLRQEVVGQTGQALPEEHTRNVLLALLDEYTKEAVQEHISKRIENLRKRGVRILEERREGPEGHKGDQHYRGRSGRRGKGRR